MIAGLHKGHEFAPLIHYLFHGRKGDQVNRGFLLGGTIMASGPGDLLAHFRYLQQLRPDVTNAVHHVHISLAPGETLAIHQWLHAVDEVATAMRWGNWAVIGHEDTLHEHVHIVATPISEGRVFPEQLRDMRVIMKCMRRLEKEFRLQRVDTPKCPRTKHGRVPRGERNTDRERAMAREGKPSRKQVLRNTIDDVIAAGFTGGGVLLEMHRRGFTPFTTWGKNGHPIGICWTDADGRRLPGARLGSEYSGRRFFERIAGGFNGERKQRVTVHPERLRAYDTQRRWDGIVRAINPTHTAVARKVGDK